MSLIQEFEQQGNWLFRYRGYMPLVVVPLLLTALFVSKPSGYLDEEPIETIWLVGCLIVMLAGIVVRAAVIGYVPSGTSGRNTVSGQRATELNQTGFYSQMRHPLYFGNFLIGLGIAAAVKVLWFILVFIILYMLYYERIMFAEEAYLRKKFGDDYDRWANKTPAFLPRLHSWVKPSLPFSWKMVLRREYPGLLVAVLAITSLELLEEVVLEHEQVHPIMWGIFGVGIILSLSLRFFKKRTLLLATPGR